MGRAKNGGQRVASTGFAAVFGQRRGASRIDLTDPTPNPETVLYTEELGRQAQAGELGPALHELRKAGVQTMRSVPLLRDLAAAVVGGAIASTCLSQQEKQGLMNKMGLGHQAVPKAGPVLAQLTEALDLHLCDVGALALETMSALLLVSARRAHLRAFARGVAADAANGGGAYVREMLGAQAPSVLANLPGVLGGDLQVRAHWAAQRVAPVQWQSFFEEALLDAEDPGLYVANRLPSLLYELAHEMDENNSR